MIGVLTSATHLIVHAGVRYWEDAVVNGVTDEEGTLIPGRIGDDWRVSLDLRAGIILDWPAGTIAELHYKVCDDGEYWLADLSGRKIAYHSPQCVPAALRHPRDRGGSDYIIFSISSDGTIADYQAPDLDPETWVSMGDKEISR